MIPAMHTQPVGGAADIPGLWRATRIGAPIPEHGTSFSTNHSHPPQPHNIARSKKDEGTAPSKKKRNPNHIPRPPNSFILFRKDFVANRPADHNASKTKSLSKQAGDAWRCLPGFEKKKWAKRAHDVAAEHARRNPDWKYKPSRKSDKPQMNPPPSPQWSRVQTGAPAFPSHTYPVDLLQGNIPPPDLMRRRESLRLTNWDDSVISPNPHIAAYPNERLEQLPEYLRRRSSSVPIPDTSYSSPGLSFPDPKHIHPLHLFSPSNMQHRLSYSGIRTGFMPMDIFDSHQDLSQHGSPEDVPLQPLSSLCEGPPPSFEGYQIRVFSEPTPVSSREHLSDSALYVSPFSQVPECRGASPPTTFDRWENSAAPDETSFSPNTSESISLRPFPPFTRVASPPMDSLRESSPISREHMQQPVPFKQVEPNNLVGRMRYIDFGSPPPVISNSGGESPECIYSSHVFPPEIPPLDGLGDFFHQHVHVTEGSQLSGFGNFDGENTVVSPRNKDIERPFFPDLSMVYSLPEVDIFDEFLEIPDSGESTCGSGTGTPSKQQLDFETAFE